MSLRWPARLLLALGSGLAHALAFPSYNVPLLAWIAVAGLLLASLGTRPRPAALLGLLHGAVFYALSLPWIYTVMRVHGGLGAMEAAGVILALVLAASLFTAAFSVVVAWLGRRSVGRALVAAPFLWVALEYAITHLPAIGFPWNLLGYAAAGNLALLQLVSVTGIYGLSLLVAGYNVLLAWALLSKHADRQRPWVLLLLTTAALLLVASLGPRYVPAPQARYVAHLVQTNFPQSPSYPADWMERHATDLNELERLSIEVGRRWPGLVIWPEVPAPFSLEDPEFAVRAQRIAQASGSDFLVGVVEWRPGLRGGPAPYNSAALLDPSGRPIFLYDKIHLVPFGEYVPLGRWLTFAKKLTAEVGDFQPGSEYRVGTFTPRAGGGRFGVLICYEAIFPAEVRRFVDNGAELLVNLSNDGWFGRSAAPGQHVAMARVRAAEERRWLLRDTNNGFTVAVDPYGRYAARLATDARGVLDARYDFRSDLTPYARWGDWVAWLSIAGVVAVLLAGARARTRRNAPA
jgi:apolipoprotein N-acyltransferase